MFAHGYLSWDVQFKCAKRVNLQLYTKTEVIVILVSPYKQTKNNKQTKQNFPTKMKYTTCDCNLHRVSLYIFDCIFLTYFKTVKQQQNTDPLSRRRSCHKQDIWTHECNENSPSHVDHVTNERTYRPCTLHDRLSDSNNPVQRSLQSLRASLSCLIQAKQTHSEQKSKF